MQNSIVIYTSHYMEGVISLVESTSLTINIIAVSGYKECLLAIEETPNLLGVLILDYAITNKTRRFYKDVMARLDKIAFSLEKTLVLSVMFRSNTIIKILSSIKTQYITIAVCKFNVLNEELIRLDGLAPIIVNTLGVFKTTPKKYFETSEENLAIQSRNVLIDALVYMLSDTVDDETLNQHFKRHPELQKIYSLKTSDEFQEECLDVYRDTVFEIFCEMMVDKR